MGEVVRFPTPRLRVVCSEMSQAQADAAQIVLFKTMGVQCLDCRDTGLKVLPRNLRLSHLEDFDIRPCPCGAAEEDFDYGGAA